MWKPPINFITLHYAYIVSFGILAMAVLYPYGNLSAVDAYFFGVSASTESGLNPVDIKDLKLYQQIFVYITPIVTNLGCINVMVVVVRLRWFRQKFKGLVVKKPRSIKDGIEIQSQTVTGSVDTKTPEEGLVGEGAQPSSDMDIEKDREVIFKNLKSTAPHIKFAPEPPRGDNGKHGLYTSGPRHLDDEEDEDAIKPVHMAAESSKALRRRKSDTMSLSKASSMDRAVSSIFVLGSMSRVSSQDRSRTPDPIIDLSSMSPAELGGTEYLALRALLKVAAGYYIGLHVFGVLCLLPWIHYASPKYTDYLAELGQSKTWWAFYSAQTMVCNLGLTLTPDSMISFRDATWPMLVMSFLALAGNTFYPVFLRLLIWTIYKLTPSHYPLKESLNFLLHHPRRCYTLLFSSTATWILAAILFLLNFIDVLLIILLDLDNPEVNILPVGSRILAAIFQAASARHTGTATFNLANVNPAVQFSLLVMMYISIYPIAISMRMSSSYEEQALGIYAGDEDVDEQQGGKTYLLSHMRNQLSFDMWYIFLGVFCICAGESKRIMDKDDHAFSVFSIFFEVVSAYGNVGLSLGYPTNFTSLCGHFGTFGKLVICAMMIRGRHRGLPYALDRAITLPSERYVKRDVESEQGDGGLHDTERENKNVKGGSMKQRNE